MTRGADVEVVGGGPATPEEVAALTAALEVVLGSGRGRSDGQPAVSPWRWSGRRWGDRPAGRRSAPA
ncbi:MAG: hypothetical protein ACRD2W_05970 [Acidimicrobiales bacterium]